MGQGIKDSGVPREEIWITTKLDNTWHHRVEEGIASSLRDLGTGDVDLYLMVSLLGAAIGGFIWMSGQGRGKEMEGIVIER